MSASQSLAAASGRVASTVALQRGRSTQLQSASNAPATRMLTTNERRRFQRVNIPLLGRYMLESRQEYPCQVVNMSAGDVAVRAPVIGDAGERIVIYVDRLGRVEGKIVRVSSEGFALLLSASPHKREKIANQLTWLVNKDRFSMIEDRRYDRIIPRKSKAKLTLSDGTSYECKVLDISLGGAAVALEAKLPVGERVTLGLTPGRIVRHADHDTSIEFLEIQDPASLESQFG